MDELLVHSGIALPESKLRVFQRDFAKILSTDDKLQTNVKQLKEVAQSLLDTADSADITLSHRAAACNSICAVIERCQMCKNADLRDFVLQDSIWTRLFDIYLRRFETAKAKPMRQVLIVLSSVLLKAGSKRALHLRTYAVNQYLQIIVQQENRVLVKPALHGLAHFLSKNVITVSQLLDLYRELELVRLSHSPIDSAIAEDLFRQFLKWIPHHDTGLAASHLVKAFLGTYHKGNINEHDSASLLPIWIRPLIDSVVNDMGKLQEYRFHVFPHCFQPDLDDYLKFLFCLRLNNHMHTRSPVELHNIGLESGLNSQDELQMLLAALQAGKEMGIIMDIDYRFGNLIQIRDGAINVPNMVFGRLLSHPIPDVRLAAMSLLVYSSAVTRPITSNTFKLLKQNLPHLQADTDANFRGELLSQLQRLFDRLRASTATIAKTIMDIDDGKKPTAMKALGSGARTVDVKSTLHDTLHVSLKFISWYIGFLEGELRPTASYQKHITALRALLIIMRSGLDPTIPLESLSKQAQGDLRWRHQIKMMNLGLFRMLLDMLLDPFDDVRQGALSILELATSLSGKHNIPEDSIYRPLCLTLPEFMKRAEQAMVRTGRADHADGVARAYGYQSLQSAITTSSTSDMTQQYLWYQSRAGIFAHLVNQLEDSIGWAQKSLHVAVEGRPIHGVFAALRYVIDHPSFYSKLEQLSIDDAPIWRNLHQRILVCFESLWTCVQSVLCNDAPEGYVPEEMEDEASVDTKEISSFCWRALKEASSLQRILISKAPIGTGPNSSILDVADVKMMGLLSFTQLAELRHRGAFSTVAQTFTACCLRCYQSSDNELRRLPEEWYRDTLLCIQNKAGVITRRSGGIPSLIIGIISAQPEGPLFEVAMEDLLREAARQGRSSNMEGSQLPQVHALNCLKSVFTTSRLSSVSEAYIGQGLDLAARSLHSELWPIRNCGLMLFKALIERLLGGSDAQSWNDNTSRTSRLSYSKFPNLLESLYNLLSPSSEITVSTKDQLVKFSHNVTEATEGVFPPLQILQQAPPPKAQRPMFRVAILDLVGSPHWHVRDMAARTLASLLEPEECLVTIKDILSNLHSTNNALHGVLLELKYIMNKCFRFMPNIATEDLSIIMQLLLDGFHQVRIDSCSSVIQASYLDLINVSLEVSLHRQQHTLGQTTRSIEENIGLLIGHTENDSSLRENTMPKRSDNISIVLHQLLLHGMRDRNDAEPVARMERLIFQLAKCDPDECCNTIEYLIRLVHQSPWKMPAIAKVGILLGIHRIMLDVQDRDIRAKAQIALAELSTDYDLRALFFEKLENNAVTRTLDNITKQCLYGPPSSMQGALRLYGVFVDHHFHISMPHSLDCLQRINQYIRLLRCILQDNNSFDSRHAAVISLAGLQRLWSLSARSRSTSSLVLGLSLLLYDALNDDDDEIRDIAASITAKFLSTQLHQPIQPVVSIFATQRLARFLAETLPSSKALFKVSLGRLLGSADLKSVFSYNAFQKSLAEARHEDTALFIQEKQNLFRDESCEVALWSQVLKKLSSDAVAYDLMKELEKWVLKGIETLTELAQSEKDGALGWSSKPDVFILVLRVICAADVLLTCDARWKELDVDSAEMRRMLRIFADVGKKAEIHDLWMRKVERVLQRSVIIVLKTANARLVKAMEQVSPIGRIR